MPSLPTKSSFTAATVTEGGFKTSMDNLRDYLNNLFGSLDTIIKVVRGNTASRPAATDGGFIRWNTETTELEMSYGTSWHQVLRGTIDATWKWNLECLTNLNGFRNIGKGISNITRTECTSGYIEEGVNATEVFLKSSDTRPLRIHINGTPVFSINSTGDLTVTGTITQKGTV